MRLITAYGLAALMICGAAAVLAQTAKGDPARGKELYQLYCVSCHGENGDGKGPVGVTLQPPPRDFTSAGFLYGGTDQDIFEVITNGAASKGGSPLMTPWGAVISEEDRWSLVRYVRSLEKK
jgi:mono/diheme cytochrome c family protein